jgi:hypothetical protein
MEMSRTAPGNIKIHLCAEIFIERQRRYRLMTACNAKVS